MLCDGRLWRVGLLAAKSEEDRLGVEGKVVGDFSGVEGTGDDFSASSVSGKVASGRSLTETLAMLLPPLDCGTSRGEKAASADLVPR